MNAERGFNPEAMKNKPKKPSELPPKAEQPMEVTDDMIIEDAEEEAPSTKRGGELLDQQAQAGAAEAAPSVRMPIEQLDALRAQARQEDFGKAEEISAQLKSGELDAPEEDAPKTVKAPPEYPGNVKKDEAAKKAVEAQRRRSNEMGKRVHQTLRKDEKARKKNEAADSNFENGVPVNELGNLVDFAGLTEGEIDASLGGLGALDKEKATREADEKSRQAEQGRLARLKNLEFVAKDKAERQKGKEEEEKRAEASAQLEGEKEVAEAIAKADTLEELVAVLQGAGILKGSDGERAYEGTELAKDVASIAEIKLSANSSFLDSLTNAGGLRNKVRELLSTSSFLEKGKKVDEAHTAGEEIEPTSAKAMGVERKQRINEMNAVDEARYSAEIAEADRQLATGTLTENELAEVRAKQNEAVNRSRRPDLVRAAYSTRSSGDSGLSQEQSDEMFYSSEKARQDLEQASQELIPLQAELKTLKDHLEYDFKVDPEDALRDRNLQGGVKKLFGFFSARTRNLNTVLDKYSELSQKETDQLEKQLRAQQRLGQKPYPKNR